MADRLSDLKVDELRAVAEFFAVEVETANPDKEPNKKEVLAALNSGDQPVTFEDYKNIYLVAEKPKSDAPELTNAEAKQEAKSQEPEGPKVLLKMERANARYDIRGYTFTKEHPFHNVSQKDAEYIIKNVEGFRVALPSELSDYYN